MSLARVAEHVVRRAVRFIRRHRSLVLPARPRALPRARLLCLHRAPLHHAAHAPARIAPRTRSPATAKSHADGAELLTSVTQQQQEQRIANARGRGESRNEATVAAAYRKRLSLYIGALESHAYIRRFFDTVYTVLCVLYSSSVHVRRVVQLRVSISQCPGWELGRKEPNYLEEKNQTQRLIELRWAWTGWGTMQAWRATHGLTHSWNC